MDKTFQPDRIERRWYESWERNGYFRPSGAGTPYCIMIPPPNVTGSLHMGHGFQEAIMDALIRYHRMDGYNTLWQVGTDHAGIATQMVVERQLEAEGTERRDIGREAFIERVWQWKQQSGGHITRQLRRLGASPDWSRERFTMDEGLSNAVREVFVRLYEEGLVYRGRRLVNWDPVLRTAISDLEVVAEEEQGKLWHFRYPLADGSGALVVATTRPETMLGDSAVAVHPEDDRYRELIGKTVRLPLVDREIPVIGDEYVDRDFGTGCVKITPAHDFNDYAMGERHGLEVINILREDATLNDAVPEAYRGLDRFEARDRVVHDLRELGLLAKVEAHTLKVPRGDRTGVVIEPFLTLQWYVDAKRLAGPAIEAVEQGAIEFVPKQWENTYFAWMRDIEDWCISRQLWWGHRIPAWYGPDGEVHVGRSEAEVRERAGLGDDIALRQDEDVLDTWFSSALWTFSTLGWPEPTEELATFHPTSVLVTGFDIIFFWVARMIMMTLHFRGEVPFRQVYVHGLVRDNDGQKMSKSKGNVLDPIDLIDGIDLEDLVRKRTAGLMQPRLAARIEKATRRQFPEGISAYGTDALRFTYYSLAATGRDIRFDVGRIEGFRNFGNKIWNAARYVLMTCEGQDCGNPAQALSIVDRWILSSLQDTTRRLRKDIEQYRFDLASQTIYDFIWSQYCDWYLELSKAVLRNEQTTEQARGATRGTLLRVLETALRLLHPLMPFLTEEIWQSVASLAGAGGESIMLQSYPSHEADLVDSEAEAEVDWLKQVVTAVRTLRSEANVPPGKAVPLLLRNGDALDRQRADRYGHLIRDLARVETLGWAADTLPPAATALVAGLELLLPLEGLIDRDAELARLDRELKRLEADAERARVKLSRPEFIEKAPADVVEKERDKSAGLARSIERLREHREKIAGLGS